MEYYKEDFQFLIKFKSNCAEHERQFNELKKLLLSAQKNNKLDFTTHLIEKHVDGKTLIQFDVLTTFSVIRNANFLLLHSSLAYEISIFQTCDNNLGYESIPIFDEYGRW